MATAITRLDDKHKNVCNAASLKYAYLYQNFRNTQRELEGNALIPEKNEGAITTFRAFVKSML